MKNGYLHVTGEENEPTVRQTHEMLLSEGIESHWLEPRDIKKLQPILNVRDLTGAAWEPQSGWADPVAAIQSLAKGARANGVEIEEGVTVLQIAHRGGKIVGVEPIKVTSPRARRPLRRALDTSLASLAFCSAPDPGKAGPDLLHRSPQRVAQGRTGFLR